MKEEQSQAEETDAAVDRMLRDGTDVGDRLISSLRSVVPLPSRLATFPFRRRRTLAGLRVPVLVAAAFLAVLATAAFAAISYVTDGDSQTGRGAPVYLYQLGSDSQPQLINRNGGVEAHSFEGNIYTVYWPDTGGDDQRDPALLELRMLEAAGWRTIVPRMGADFSFSVTAGIIAFEKEGSLTFASLRDGSVVATLSTPPGVDFDVLGVSPTGEAVAARVRVVATEQPEELWILRSDGSSERVASIPSGTFIASARWLDDSAVLVQTFRVQVPPSVFRLELGASLEPFGPEGEIFSGAVPAPGGDLVALSSAPNADGLQDTVIVDGLGNELFSIPLEAFRDWSPDGSRFVTISKGALHIYTRDGEKQEDIVLPPGEALGIVHWTADGESLIISGGMV